jgi:hypothetical protein
LNDSNGGGNYLSLISHLLSQSFLHPELADQEQDEEPPTFDALSIWSWSIHIDQPGG